MKSSDASTFVNCFRHASPYLHIHRGRTFVISLSGQAIQSPHFPYIIHDIALLYSLGIRIVVVHGIRTQIEQCLEAQHIKSTYVDGLRITDSTVLDCVKVACGKVMTNIMSQFSLGFTNFPHLPSTSLNKRLPTVTGNFITARPMGVRNGVDFCYSGEVRRVDATAIQQQLDQGFVVVIPPIAYSPTGETFNLLYEDVAAKVAISLGAAKWLCLADSTQFINDIHQMTVEEAQQWLQNRPTHYTQETQQMKNAIQACQQGVERVHFIDQHIDGALLLELFSRDGIGTLISDDPFEYLRHATVEDIGGILELIEPLEKAGIVVRRSREKLETEIEHFIVQERDGMLVSCAALYPFQQEKMAELACLAVHQSYRAKGKGNVLLAYLERQAKQLGIEKIFVLTTHTAHWFQERGFVPDKLETLPVTRQSLFNHQRNSKIFVKTLN